MKFTTGKRRIFELPLFLTVLCAAMFLCAALSASAATVTVDGFEITYKWSAYAGENGEFTSAEITKYTGSETDLTFPTEFTAEVYPKGSSEKVPMTGKITAIGSSVFKGNEYLTSAVIPEGYTSIGLNAFQGCTGLASVSIPGSVSMISANAFEGCSALAAVTFAANGAEGAELKIMNAAFSGCAGLESIALPGHFNATANYMDFLRGCTSLTTITLGAGCTEFVVEDDILYQNHGDNLALVTYPAGKTATVFTVPAAVGGKPVDYLGGHCFQDNPTLTEVTVPDSVTTYAMECFRGCSQLRKITLECTAAPSVQTNAFADLADGCTICVQNADVAAALKDKYNNAKVVDPSTLANSVNATLSLAVQDALDADGKVCFDLYVDSANHLSNLIFTMTFDAAQVDEGRVTLADGTGFTVTDSVWSEAGGKRTVQCTIGHTGNDAGITLDARTRLATVAVPVKAGVSGEITAAITEATVAGVVDPAQSAVSGEVTLAAASASFHIVSMDVNADGVIDQLDLTEAQRYYQVRRGDGEWTAAAAADVNGDGVVDLADLVALFRAIITA